jgi:hypothetical protein
VVKMWVVLSEYVFPGVAWGAKKKARSKMARATAARYSKNLASTQI